MSYLIGDTCRYETDIKNKIDEKEYKIMSKNTYYGHALRTFEIENGRVSKATVRDVVGGVRNNSIVEKTREHGIGEWKVVNGSVFIYHDNNGNVYTEEEASEKISELEERIEDAKLRRSSIEMEAITMDNIYKLMLNFGKLYDIISDEEKKSLITYLIKEIQIYPNGESEMPLKSIEFNFPIYRDGQEVRRLLWEKGNTVETVCLMSRKEK